MSARVDIGAPQPHATGAWAGAWAGAAGRGLRAVFLRQRRRIALSLALLLATLLAGIALLGLSGGFLTAAALAVGGLAGGFNLFMPSAAIRGLTLLRIASRYGEKLAGHDATLAIARDLRAWLFRRLLPLAPVRLGALRDGAVLARLLGDIETADGLLVRAAGPLAATALASLGVAIVAAAWHGPAGLLLGGAAVVAGALVPLSAARGGQRLEQARAGAREALRQQVHEGIAGAADLAALGAGHAWAQRIEAGAHALATLDRRRRTRLIGAQALLGACTTVTIVALLWIVAGAVHGGTLSAPLAVALCLAALGLAEAWTLAAPAWQALQSGQVALSRLVTLAACAPAVADHAPAGVLPPGPQSLACQGVGFAWPGAAGQVFGQFDFVLAAGERVVLRGDSGRGKSTLAALLLRLVDPSAGRVVYGGVDLRTVAQAHWHRRIAWLPQDAPVLAGSVRDNLAIGDACADDAAMMQALRQVRLDGLVRAIGGLDAWIGEDGATLSTGQARRLALARALLRRDADIWLLDEPTEGLDAATAQALLADVVAALNGRSLLLVTHDALPPGVADRTVHLS